MWDMNIRILSKQNELSRSDEPRYRSFMAMQFFSVNEGAYLAHET
jgi:hypothetical protein